MLTPVSTKRQILEASLFNSLDSELWEKAYVHTMETKYSKYHRSYKVPIPKIPWNDTGKPPLYIVPRIRGGPSYKSVPLEGLTSDQVFYALASKGFPMQEVSSFTLGPIVGEGLCLVNAAFSKVISSFHIEGNGIIDYRRKNFWRPSRRPERKIEFEASDRVHMKVNGETVVVNDWLRENEDLWLDDWETWRKNVALCSRGDFHWSAKADRLGHRHHHEYLSFVDWKKQCYIQPSYDLLPETKVYKTLLDLRAKKIPIALVHPMGFKHEAGTAVTRAQIRMMFDSDTIMSCQPYVVAGKLLEVPVYKKEILIN